jgi:tetratricopeptide (TPR) repeat protein
MGVNLQRALLLFEQSRYDLAEKELRQELAADPHHPHAHALLALCLAEREEFKEATEEAQLAIAHAPDYPFAHYAHASILHDRNRYDEALVSAKEAVRLDPGEAMYYGMLAAILMSLRRWPESLEAAEQGLRLNPEHAGCTNLRAIALVKLGRRAEAGATIDSALAKDPENAVTHANQGWTLLHANQPQKAMEHFKEALRIDPTMEWAREGIVEALKARYFIYGLMLRYFLWMSRLSKKMGMAVILGGYIGYRVLLEVANKNPALAPWIWPILGVYIGFVLLSWIAIPLFNLVLRLNKFGRLALSEEQTYASNWVGSGILLALMVVGAWLASGHFLLKLAALISCTLVFPLSATFLCPKGWPRLVMGGYTAVLYLIGAALMAVYLAAMRTTTQSEVDMYLSVIRILQDIELWGVILSLWAANFLMMANPKR